MFFEINVLKKFTKFTGKHLCWSLFLIILQAYNFPVDIAKFLKNSFLHKTPPVAASKISIDFSGKHQ